MIFRRLSQFLAAAALAVTFVIAAGAASGSEVKAQGYYRNYNWGRRGPIIRQRQRERFYWNRYRQRQRSEWRWRNRYYNRSPYYRRYNRRW
jgi:hypothetical protein